ncbi:MAG: hypothetical protein LBB19_01865 [Puniceicoccales bacterium]|jgi:hypothetical protein|nr:hypothetical protein [Puniceicoccales bacterium]
MNLQSLKLYLVPKPCPWEIDFRDKSIVVHSQLSSIKIYVLAALGILTVILIGVSCFTELDHKRQTNRFNEIKTFLDKNTALHQQMMQHNKDFVETRNMVHTLLNAYTLPIDLPEFLLELCKGKPHEIRFNTIIANCQNDPNTKVVNAASKSFNIQIYGIVKGDVAILESYKTQLLQLKAIDALKNNCKCFYNLEKNNADQQVDETRFQINLQYNA